MSYEVIFDEPDNIKIKARKLIAREPGVLSHRLIKFGVVSNVTQAKIAIAVTITGCFLACAYFLEAAISGPDIPPRPPSTAYETFNSQRQ